MTRMIGCFGCSSVGIAGITFLVITVVVATMSFFGGSTVLQACAPSNPTGGSGVVQASATTSAGPIPSNYDDLYEEVGKLWRIPPYMLAGIGWVETHHGTWPKDGKGVHFSENGAGAGGPMQFLKGSWEKYGADGNGDGRNDRYNPEDAIPGAANHLRGSVGKEKFRTVDEALDGNPKSLSRSEIVRAIHLYNPGNYTVSNNPYVKDVLAAANHYKKDYEVVQANYAGTGVCSGAMLSGSGSFGQRIANAAAYWAKREPGVPKPSGGQTKKTIRYSWGGGVPAGPDHGICCSPSGTDARGIWGFDCSGLALHAVHKASNGKITMPRTSQAMWASDKGVRVPRDQVAPGDLVFSHGAQPTHMGIYYGEVNGVRWLVEASGGADYVKFSKFDEWESYVGALRVTPPPGMKNQPPDVIRALPPAGAGVGEGAM